MLCPSQEHKLLIQALAAPIPCLAGPAPVFGAFWLVPLGAPARNQAPAAWAFLFFHALVAVCTTAPCTPGRHTARMPQRCFNSCTYVIITQRAQR